MSNGFELLYEQCSLHMTREHGELEVVRVAAAEPVADRVELLVGHAQAAMERLHGALRHGHQMPTVTRRSPTALAALSTSERTIPAPSSEPRMASDARSGWGMSPATLPAALITPGDGPQRPVRVGGTIVLRRGVPRLVDVAEQDAAVGFERVERRRIGEVAALAVGDRHAQRPGAVERVGERRIEPLGRDRDLAPQEPHVPVAEQGPGHEPGLGQDLEAVADAEHEAAVVGECGDRRA